MGNSANREAGNSGGVPSSERLDSWKEIAAYLKRTERTARRWENTEALPVFRHAHGSRHSVYAYKADLDAWWSARRSGPDKEDPGVSLWAKATRHRRFSWAGVIAGVVGVAAGAVWLLGRTDIRLAEPFKIVPLTSYRGFERYSSFSPDGSQVAFSWKQESRGRFQIYTKPIRNGEVPGVPMRRTNHAADHLSPAWSPDGRFIAFFRSLSGEKAELVLIPASGGPERQLAVISRPNSAPSSLILFGHDVAWSPDSKFLIVPSRDSLDEPFGLFLVSVETGVKRRLLSSARNSETYLAPSFSPDGRHLAFVRRTDFVVSEIWVNTLLPDYTPWGQPKRMTYEDRLTTSPIWSPDGREIMFLSGEIGAEASL